MSNVPMKRTKKYPAQSIVNLATETDKKMRELKGLGVDTGELRRLAVTEAIERAYSKMVAS